MQCQLPDETQKVRHRSEWTESPETAGRLRYAGTKSEAPASTRTGSGREAHEVGVLGVDKTSGLLTEHLLGEMVVQEGIGDIQLVHRPGARDRPLKYGANRAQFDNRGEGSVKSMPARC